MDLFLTMLVPLLMLSIALWGLIRKVDLWTALVDGAGDGLKVTLRIAPPLIALLTAVYMLRASGALELLGQLLEPMLSAVGIPVETIGLILVRPVSGSAALGVGAELINTGRIPWWDGRRRSCWDPLRPPFILLRSISVQQRWRRPAMQFRRRCAGI